MGVTQNTKMSSLKSRCREGNYCIFRIVISFDNLKVVSSNSIFKAFLFLTIFFPRICGTILLKSLWWEIIQMCLKFFFSFGTKTLLFKCEIKVSGFIIYFSPSEVLNQLETKTINPLKIQQNHVHCSAWVESSVSSTNAQQTFSGTTLPSNS